jgi:hypothetical protein
VKKPFNGFAKKFFLTKVRPSASAAYDPVGLAVVQSEVGSPIYIFPPAYVATPVSVVEVAVVSPSSNVVGVHSSPVTALTLSAEAT